MRRSLFFALLLGAIIGGGAGAFAAEKELPGLPEWMLGQWVVTKVYEDPYTPYPDPKAEPVKWLSNQIMTVEPKRIELGKKVCADFSVHEGKSTLGDLVDQQYGVSVESFGLSGGENNRYVKYIILSCVNIIHIDGYAGIKNLSSGPMDWEIITEDRERLEMPFYGGSYLELHRLAPTT